MTRIAYVAATVGFLVCSAQAFAQNASGTGQPAAVVPIESTNDAAHSGTGTDTNGQSAAGASTGLTRAEVKEELYRAEQDGELKRLYSTIYDGGS